MNDLRELRLGQILRADGRVNVGAFENLFRVDRANAVNVAERNVNALAGRNFHTNDACHKIKSTLPLLVACVLTNNAHHPAAADNLALVADLLH